MLTEQLIKQLLPQLKKQAKKYTKNYEDLIQDTLLAAWIIRDKFTSDKIPLKFLFCVMKSVYFDNRRKENTIKRSIPNYASAITFRYPNQLSVVSLNECSKLPNFDFALLNALGYSLEETIANTKENTNIDYKRTTVFKYTKQFQEAKEEYV